MLRVLKYGTKAAEERLEKIARRSLIFDKEHIDKVSSILTAVKEQGDRALSHFTKRFDGVAIKQFKVQKQELDTALKRIDKKFVDVLLEAVDNVRRYHERQKQNSWFIHEPDGTMLGQRILPFEKVGLYVPGGTAAYPSTVIMNAVPAQVAGVTEISVVTPPQKNGMPHPLILATCRLLGIEDVFSVGGAQAIAALAYGTESVPRVDKIVGPGNLYVAIAKKLVYGDVAVDMIAGPSEVVIIADETADSGELAADLLAQAEHDINAASILITTDSGLARKVSKELSRLLTKISRKAIAEQSLMKNGVIFVVSSPSEAAAIVNEIAPEHLEIVTEKNWDILTKIRNAGAVFLGRYTPEPIGDYFAGPSHVLPTGGTARFSSVLNVDDFMKKSSVIHYSREKFFQNAWKVETFAKNEGLTAHAMSIKIRKERGR
ncbi:MAG: histidinol dehydrogenase [Candidatus Kryptoniota bacterium]